MSTHKAIPDILRHNEKPDLANVRMVSWCATTAREPLAFSWDNVDCMDCLARMRIGPAIHSDEQIEILFREPIQ